MKQTIDLLLNRKSIRAYNKEKFDAQFSHELNRSAQNHAAGLEGNIIWQHPTA